MVQAGLHGIVAAEVQACLRCRDSHWGFASDLDSQCNRIVKAGLRRICYLGDKPSRKGFIRVKVASSVGKLSGPAVVPNYFLEPLKRANICSESNIDLLDCKLRVLAANPDIAGRHQVNSCADAEPMNSGNDRDPNLLQRANRLLQRSYHIEQSICRPGSILSCRASLSNRHGRHQVQPCREVFANTRKHDRPNRRVRSAQVFDNLL